MSYITDHKQKFADLKRNIENQDQLRRQANGGNSILFCFPSDEEHLYIKKAKELYAEGVAFIDISRLFVKLIDEDGWDSFRDYRENMGMSSHKVFFDKESTETDLFDLILAEIKDACHDNKIPILIRTGCLFGTGIKISI